VHLRFKILFVIGQVHESHIYFKRGEQLVKQTMPCRVSVAKSKMDFAVTVVAMQQNILLGQIEVKKLEQKNEHDLSSSSNFRQTVCYSITSLAYSRWGPGKCVFGDSPLVSILLDQKSLYKLIFTKPLNISEHPFRLRLRVEIYSKPSKMYEVLTEYTRQIVTDYKNILRAVTLSRVHPAMWSPINFDFEEADSRFGNKWNLGFVFKAKGSRFLEFSEPDLSFDHWAAGMSSADIDVEDMYFVKCLHSILTLGWRESLSNVIFVCERSISEKEYIEVSKPRLVLILVTRVNFDAAAGGPFVIRIS
jgi:hypothetical protein